MKLLEEARKLGFERKKYKIEGAEKNITIAYTSWQTELRKGQRIDVYEDAIPLLYMMQKEVPNCVISKFFVDVYGDRNVDRRKELTTKFQLSFLMENRNEYEEEETWYLTFECNNITATMSKEELEELRKAAELETKLKEITDGMMFELNHGDDAETMEFVMGKKVVSVPINEISYNFLFEHFEKLLIELQEYYK